MGLELQTNEKMIYTNVSAFPFAQMKQMLCLHRQELQGQETMKEEQ